MGIREDLLRPEFRLDISEIQKDHSVKIGQWIVRDSIGKVSQLLPYICYFSSREGEHIGGLGSNCRGYVSSAREYVKDLRACGKEEIANRAEELIVCAAAGLQFPKR